MEKRPEHSLDHSTGSMTEPKRYYNFETGQLEISPDFDDIFAYEGELGVRYSPEASRFRLWAPVAEKVTLLLFGDQKEQVTMTRTAECIFEVTIYRNLDNTPYLYELIYPDGTIKETTDPYATAATANGERSVVVDLLSTNPANWSNRMAPFSAPTDAIIYEAHIRDFTIHPASGVKEKGKFLGVIEEGTTTPNGKATGLDYLKELGITHVQFLPMYDFQTVDELNPGAKYNWGYDPQNYNVPEGSYATDPTDPKSRIREMKQMIQGLHDAGIRVIMDVVYNHVFEAETHPFELTAPGYFFRKNEDGSPSNGTGVGNDTASEHAMMHKYMIESIRYWAKEFHLDGFRFDLMGIHDVDTMNEIRATLDEIDPSIIILGEGWDLNTSLPADEKANNKNADQMERIAHFNDALRTAIKGSDMDGGGDLGFVSGKSFMEQWIAINQQGGTFYPDDVAGYEQPDQMVQYVEAHDNYTLYDKLVINQPDDSLETRSRRHLLASTLVLLSQGIPFIHAGQEFLRTKNLVENSYQSPDEINWLDWTRKDTKEAEVAYMKGLIALRKSEPLFRMRDTSDIAKNMEVLKADYFQIVWQLENAERKYYVIFNANGNPIQFDIEPGDYNVLIHDGKIVSETWENISTVQVEGFSATVIKQDKV